MDNWITVGFNMYAKCKKYIEGFDLVIVFLIVIILLYFMMYIVSFFFKLPFIIMVAILIGYYIYINKINLLTENVKII